MSTDTGAARAETTRGGAAPFVLPLYTLTLFLSAFLLFAVQPMFTKMVLPLLGGSAAVWNTAVVFFQATLLLGYAYAHFSTRWLGPKAQTLLHGGVLLIGLVSLPIGVVGWTPPTGETQIPWLIGLLAVSIGLPFFAVSATAPLLQKWFAHTDHAAAGDPYFLYGGSNLGSLVALLSYPLLVEPLLGLHAQGRAWTIGYALLGAAIATCGVTLVRRYRAAEAAGAAEDEGLIAEVTWKLRARWLALSTVPSALLLGVTLHIGTDVASMPFLWVLPLSLYLLTFVLVFARRQLVPPKWWAHLQVTMVVLVAALFQTPALWLMLVLHVGAMFATAMVCHGELARLRPRASHLTEFYLWMSIGGVLGGILSAIVAPLVFDGVYEYPLALCAALLLRPWPAGQRAGWRYALDVALPLGLWWILSRVGTRQAVIEQVAAVMDLDLRALLPEQANRLKTGVGVGLAVLGGVPLLCLITSPLRFALGFGAVLLALAPELFGNPKERLTRERSFFGVYAVNREEYMEGLVLHTLQNGTTNHGAQNTGRPLAPVTYYTNEGPVGQFFDIIKSLPTPVERIGAIGLGAGAIAAHVRRDQRMTFFEIDPLDEAIARDPRYFTYLRDAGERVNVVIGDGRLTLAREPDGAFGALIVDAFSSDAIPIHLMTREALALYFQKLTPRGLLLVHITNVYLDLLPIIGNLAADAGLHARTSLGFQPNVTLGGAASDWVVIGRTPQDLQRFAFTHPPWTEVGPAPDHGLWTDDSSSVIEVLRWKSDYVIR
jgi:hypothetical protein